MYDVYVGTFEKVNLLQGYWLVNSYGYMVMVCADKE